MTLSEAKYACILPKKPQTTKREHQGAPLPPPAANANLIPRVRDPSLPPPRCHSPLPSCHPRAKRRISMGNTSESRGGLLEEDRRTRRASNDATSAPANAKRTPSSVLCVVCYDLNKCYDYFQYPSSSRFSCSSLSFSKSASLVFRSFLSIIIFRISMPTIAN